MKLKIPSCGMTKAKINIADDPKLRDELNQEYELASQVQFCKYALWINAGDSVMYEYNESHPDSLGKPVIYNDYQLSRFIEDVLELAPFISESVPESLFNVIENLAGDFRALKDRYIDKSDEEFDVFYDDVFEPLSE